MRLPLLALLVAAASIVAGAEPAKGRSATFKIATWNVRSGMGVQGFGTRHWSHETLNCTDRSKPLNAWGLGLPQRELQRIAADPAIVALAVQEAWNCGRPENLRSVLGFKTTTRERNGVALLARHGLAGPHVERRIGTAGYDSWLVGGRVCLDAACAASVPVFSTHWGAKQDDEWALQAQHVVDFLVTQPRPHLLAGDLNVFRIDRWNPGVRCTSADTPGRSRAIEILERAGYVDAWKATQQGEGWTGMTSRPGCGSPRGNLYKRIDYVYAMQLPVVSTTRFARPPPGADAPSDHVGLIAELRDPDRSTPGALAIDARSAIFDVYTGLRKLEQEFDRRPILHGDASRLLEKFTVATFGDHLGGAFRIYTSDSQHVTVELIEVTDLTSRGGPEAARSARAPFSLVFRGPQGAVLPQRIYRMEHEQIGAFELFLVPIGPDRTGMRYEAIFT